MRIVEVKSTVVALPRSDTLTTQYGSGDLATTVLVELVTDEGLVGLGQTAVAPRSYGETAEGIVADVHAHLAPVLLASDDPTNLARLHLEVERALPHHWSSHAGVELALWDLVGKVRQLPVHALLGGKIRPGLSLMGFVHHDTPDRMATEASDTLDRHGFDVLKMKVGLDPVDDVRRYRAVAEAVAGRARIQVDGNTGYAFDEALWALSEMEAIGGLGAIEQPVADRADLAELARRLSTPIMADEAIYAPDDAIGVVRDRAASLALMKITKHGGIQHVREIATIFDAAHLRLSVAIYFDLIAVTAAHLAAALPCVRWPSPFTYLDDTILASPFEPTGTRLDAPDGPGWGVDFDPDKVDRYAVSTARSTA